MIVFDVDGTLLVHGDGGHGLDPGCGVDAERDAWRSAEPCKTLVGAAQRCSRRQDVAYLTGRGEEHRDLTRTQLIDAQAPAGPLFMQPDGFTGYDGMITFKTSILRALAPTCYVADRPEDMKAASKAECGFLDAEELRENPIQHDWAAWEVRDRASL